MTKTATIGVLALIAVAALAAGGYYAFAHNVAPSGTTTPVEGVISQGELNQATASLKNVVEAAGGASFDFTAQPTYHHYANFGIVQQVNEVKSVSVVNETAIRFAGKTDNEFAEVDPATNQVVAFHREADYTGGTKTQTQLEAQVRAFLAMVYPNFTQVEPTLTFTPGMKGVRLNNGNYFFDWEDDNYQKQLPAGVQTERAPFIQVSITSSGFIFGYNNTIDLYRNALQELAVTR